MLYLLTHTFKRVWFWIAVQLADEWTRMRVYHRFHPFAELRGEVRVPGLVRFLDPELLHFGDRVTITPGVTFINHDGAVAVFREDWHDYTLAPRAPTYVHDNVFIGMGATILPGVTIGPNAVIGAGSVVTGDVPEGRVYAGNPAREICTLEAYRERAAAQLVSREGAAALEMGSSDSRPRLQFTPW